MNDLIQCVFNPINCFGICLNEFRMIVGGCLHYATCVNLNETASLCFSGLQLILPHAKCSMILMGIWCSCDII